MRNLNTYDNTWYVYVRNDVNKRRSWPPVNIETP